MSNLATRASDEVADRARRLTEYLRKLAQLRTTQVRRVDQYESILWLHEVPHELGCFSMAWGKASEDVPDIWVEVGQRREPQLPVPPGQCEDWVDHASLQSTGAEPRLLEIIVSTVAPRDGDGAVELPQELRLCDHPEVTQAWTDYVEKSWRPWAEAHRRWESVHRAYARLYEIYKMQQRLGEEYELIVGIGLLQWKTPSGHEVRRHLITARCDLEFEPTRSRLVVKPHVRGVQLSVELDMLDTTEQPLGSEDKAKAMLAEAEDDPWDRPIVDDALITLAASISNKGDYFADAISPEKASNDPVVLYSPAVILRRRTQRGLLKVLEELSRQISEGAELPPAFAQVCEQLCEDNGSADDIDNFSAINATEAQTIYFPLPTNSEQERIARALDSQKMVLVQGPPGTGKSHTITNLICHLLATGRRILVTAQTPRALTVLREKLPEELLPLCISLLGTGIDERKVLEQSVQGMLNRYSNWDAKRNWQQQAELEKKLVALKAERAEIDCRITTLREKETRTFVVGNGAYHGTAGRIAERVSAEKSAFSWFGDKVGDDQCPIAEDDLRAFLTLRRKYSPERETELSLSLPTDEQLPTPDEFRDAVEQERKLKCVVEDSADQIGSANGIALSTVNASAVKQIELSLNGFLTTYRTLSAQSQPWQAQALDDVLHGTGARWTELFRHSAEILNSLGERPSLADQTHIALPDIDRRQIEADALKLLGHLKEHKFVGWWKIRPKIVRETAYLFGARINGVRCDTPNTLQLLVDHLVILRKIEMLWELWDGRLTRTNDSLAVQVAILKENAIWLQKCLQFAKARGDIVGRLQQISGLQQPDWRQMASVAELLATCSATLAAKDFAASRSKFDSWATLVCKHARREGVHPISNSLASSIEARDVNAFCKKTEELQNLRREADGILDLRRFRECLSFHVPLLIEQLESDPNNSEWDARIGSIAKAWTWRQASDWILRFLELDLPALERRSRELEREIEKATAMLAAACAWANCFEAMTNEHREHLKAWQLAMSHYGVGKGKHAAKYLRDAQKHLEGCKEAVPAWIMPLYRVYETVPANPGTFDVVIVDEASQCGPDAIPLLYLAKKILVVGDDKQISPEGVGIEQDEIRSLMQRYLHDFRHQDTFNVTTSLFAHADVRARQRIVLREHFRCMPEIIRFSNDLCYESSPLIPLRQYPPNRLEPLILCHVSNGFREGDGQYVRNIREAEAVVETIINCCRDERYLDKTMGVIVLQGKTQAREIEQRLLDRLGAEELERRRIVCGEPYSFQGDERDVVFLSLVAAPNERIGPLTKNSDQQRFNVAASRARDQMWLFHTATPDDLSPNCLRRKLLEYFLDPHSRVMQSLGADAERLQRRALEANRSIEKPPTPYESWFELDVALEIAGRGYRVVPQFEMADRRIDLMVEGTIGRLAVECDGDHWHGADRFAEDMYRQRKLERMGLTFFRMRESTFYSNRESALHPLWEELARMGICSQESIEPQYRTTLAK